MNHVPCPTAPGSDRSMQPTAVGRTPRQVVVAGADRHASTLRLHPIAGTPIGGVR